MIKAYGMKTRISGAIPFLWLIAVAILTSCIIDKGEKGAADLKPGDTAPAFSVRMDNGRTITDETLRGTPSVIVFFHTGCGDCRNELPVLQRFYNEYGKTVNVLCISRAESADDVSFYWTTNGLTLPYSAQDDAEIYYRFAKSVIPRVYIVDRDLVIRQVFTDDPIATYGELVEAVSTL